MSDESVVEQDGITVRKAFDADGFPVPAVTFLVESERSDAVGLRITDDIPEAFGIEQIGFHPDYGSEHWTATGDGVVRFERTVDPGESFTTVYGIRMAEDEEPTPFLEPPVVEIDPDAIEESEIEEVVPKETSEVVRELAGGKRDTVPGLDDEAVEADEPAESVTPAASETEADATSAGGEHAEILEESDDAEATADAVAGDEPEAEFDEPEAEFDEPEAEVDEPAGEAEIVDADDELSAQTPDAIAQADADAADEIVGEEAPADDESELEDEGRLEAESAGATTGLTESAEDVPEPPEAESGPEDVESPAEEPADEPIETAEAEPPAAEPTADAPPPETGSVAAALAAEIREGEVDDADLEVIEAAVRDRSPSDAVRVEHLQSRVSDIEAYSDALEAFIDENGEAQELLGNLEAEIETLAESVEAVEEQLDTAATKRESVVDRLDAVEANLETIADVDEQVERLRGDLDALDERVDDAESLRFEVESLVEDVESLESDLEDVTEWRDQLQNVFQ